VTFQDATDALSGRVTHEELAEELGCSLQAIRQARMDPDSPHYRKPPVGWEAAVAKLARRRGKELEGLAKKLEESPADEPRKIARDDALGG
jgi:hypothetical protein